MMLDVEMSRKRVLTVGLIEDDPVVRMFLIELIRKHPNEFDLIGAWESAEAAVKPSLRENPDVVLVDLELPGASGVEWISEVSPHLSSTSFVVVTVHSDPERVFSALRAGASGYLLKSTHPPEITNGIIEAANGGAPLSKEVARLVIKTFQEPVQNRRKEIPGLTPRESQILHLLAEGMVPKEVGDDLGISYETVREHLKSVYRKLHVKSRTEAVIKYLRH